MFSQASVSHSVNGGYLWHRVRSGKGISSTSSLLGVGGYVQGWVGTPLPRLLTPDHTHIVGKWAVRILLECFLVNYALLCQFSTFDYYFDQCRKPVLKLQIFLLLGSGSLAAMAVFEDGYKPDMAVCWIFQI